MNYSSHPLYLELPEKPAPTSIQLVRRHTLRLRRHGEIRVYRNGQENHGEEVDGKSILSLAMLAAEQGTVLEVEARGPDAEQAVTALVALAFARFYEDDDGDSVEQES